MRWVSQEQLRMFGFMVVGANVAWAGFAWAAAARQEHYLWLLGCWAAGCASLWSALALERTLVETRAKK